jgi:hypothetical protein
MLNADQVYTFDSNGGFLLSSRQMGSNKQVFIATFGVQRAVAKCELSQKSLKNPISI